MVYPSATSQKQLIIKKEAIMFDPNQMLKQMLDFNKTAFDNSFKAMLTIGEQNEKMVNTFLTQATGVPEEGKKPHSELGRCL
jgi:hypothetical protein